MATVCCIGCEDLQRSSVPSEKPSEPSPSLYSPQGLRQALLSFETRLGTPIRVLSLRVLPRRALLQAASTTRDGEVDQYEYVDGHLLGPTPVTLKGKGELKENLFRLRSASLENLPALIEEATRTAKGSQVTLVTLKRALPDASEPRFMVTLSGSGSDTVVVANRRGIILESPRPPEE